MDVIIHHEDVSNTMNTKKGYRVTIGRDTIRVVSVFSGTKTASEAIHEAAVKKIIYEKATG